MFDAGTLATYLQVIMINIVLSGDNVIVIGMAAAALPEELRRKAIVSGIGAAAVIRVVFAIIAAKLLAVRGIALIGGLLLGWVCWNMFGELWFTGHEAEAAADTPSGESGGKMLRQAIIQIIVADVSMSLDNVLAVAGAAKEHISALVFGLILSVVLMGVASSFVARLMERYKWIAWAGLAIIVYVAADMTIGGGEEVLAWWRGA